MHLKVSFNYVKPFEKKVFVNKILTKALIQTDAKVHKFIDTFSENLKTDINFTS